MGIKNLKKNLSCIKKYYTIENYNKKKGGTSNFNEEIDNFICHIDFSILLYKILLTSENMSDVINKIQNFFLKIKKNNVLILYIDPEENIKKQNLQKNRKIEKEKFSKKLNEEIKKEISILDNFNLCLNTNYKNILDEKNIEEDYDIYKEKINIFEEEIIEEKKEEKKEINENNFFDNILIPSILVTEDDDVISEEEKVIEKVETNLTEKVETNINEIVEEKVETNINELVEEKVETNINELVEEEKDEEYIIKKKEIKEEIVPLIDKKKIFSLFITKSKYNYHCEYILKKLLKNKTIEEKEIIYTKNIDAEIKIIKNIKKNCLKYNNIIFSVDQDILLFSLLNINDKYIYIKEKFDIFLDNTFILVKSNISLNITFLTFIFNKSDYFPGIKQFEANENKFLKLFSKEKNSKLLLKQKYDDIKILCATFLQFFQNKLENYDQRVNENYINKYFEEIELYFSMKKKFYLTKNSLIYTIHIGQLYYYLKHQSIKKMCYNEKTQSFFLEEF